MEMSRSNLIFFNMLEQDFFDTNKSKNIIIRQIKSKIIPLKHYAV